MTNLNIQTFRMIHASLVVTAIVVATRTAKAVEPQVGPPPAFSWPVVTIEGTCVGNNDELLAGVTVRLFVVSEFADSPVELKRSVTTKEGLFYFDQLPSVSDASSGFQRCRYYVTAAAPGRASAYKATFTENHNEWTLKLTEPAGKLTGRIVDENGKPLEGVTLSWQSKGSQPVTAVMSDATDANGQFEIADLHARVKDGIVSPLLSGRLHLWREGYPRQYLEYENRADVEYQMMPGAVIAGRVIDSETGQPARGASVSAFGIDSTLDTAVRTDEEGRYRLVVLADRYKMYARSPDRISIAQDPWQVPSSGTVSGVDIELVRPGWIAGKVLDAKSGEPVIRSAEGYRLAVATTKPNVRSADISDDGVYRLPCVPGNHYPFITRNLQADRIRSNAMRMPAVKVVAGQTMMLDLHVESLEAPPEPEAGREADQTAWFARIHEAPFTVRELVSFLEQQEQYDDAMAYVIRELIRRGPPAVPELCQELDRARDAYKLRCLIFALRGIGDKRAVPALIRAFPRTCVPPGSRLGLAPKAPELLRFMKSVDVNPSDEGNFYSFSGPTSELCAALQRLTGSSHGENSLRGLDFKDNAIECDARIDRLQECAERWAGWWEMHWREHVGDEAYAKVNLPRRRRFLQSD